MMFHRIIQCIALLRHCLSCLAECLVHAWAPPQVAVQVYPLVHLLVLVTVVKDLPLVQVLWLVAFLIHHCLESMLAVTEKLLEDSV